jgi:methionine--tRNA ligase beta chain
MMITMDDFRLIDLRVGRVIAAETITGTSRLMKVRVDLGTEQRNLVAGLATFYTSEQLLGAKVVVVTNLQPATICGVRSEGMLLGAGCSDGHDVALITVNKDVRDGTRVE